MNVRQLRSHIARKLSRAKDWKEIRLERKEREKTKKREGKNELED